MFYKLLTLCSASALILGCNVTGDVNNTNTMSNAKDNNQSTVADNNALSNNLEPSTLLPLSDPSNSGGWLLNTLVSDEFNDAEVDHNKWYVQGTNQEFYLWKGRAPSQFAPHNVSENNGKLILTTQWEPDYDFVGTPPAKQAAQGYQYENITTAAVIAQNNFLYGYMEVKVKIPKAAMTGAFWATGYQSEIDVFEHVGRVKVGNKNAEKIFTTSIHDWRPGHPAKNKVWKTSHPIDFDMTEDFHVFGVEWTDKHLKVFIDGQLAKSTSKTEIGDAWVLNNPMELWFDSEVFPWFGVPEAHELPATFEIDYVRVWQQPNNNLLEPAFFGFEGPYTDKSVKKPNRRETGAKHWFFAPSNPNYFAITEDKDFRFNSGRKSLAFTHSGPLVKDATTAFSPYGSVNLPAGNFTLSMKVWVEPNSSISQAKVTLENPWTELAPIDLNTLTRGEWVNVTKTFTRKTASTSKDRLRLSIDKKEAGTGKSQVYFDDIVITPSS